LNAGHHADNATYCTRVNKIERRRS